MKRGSLAGISALLVAVSAVAAAGGEGFRPSIPDAVYARGIPSPEAATGVSPGSRPLRPEEILRYFETLASSCARAKVFEYARSHEGRPLVILAVSDEPTIARLDSFREEHARLADPRGRAESDDARLIDGAKAVAWMAYGIHGDELSSSDAAVALADAWGPVAAQIDASYYDSGGYYLVSDGERVPFDTRADSRELELRGKHGECAVWGIEHP